MKPNSDDLSDEALVERARDASDPAAAAVAADHLLARYRDRIVAWCRRSTRDREAALDLSQEILLKIHRSLDSFESRARFSTWVFMVVRNACISHSRRVRPPEEDMEILEQATDPSPRPDEELGAAQAYEQLLDRMQAVLTQDEYDALWMRCVDGRGVDEITETLGIDTASGARGLLQSARRKLRKALGARREEPR